MTLAGFPEVNRSMSEFAIYRSSTFAILLWPEQAQVTIGDFHVSQSQVKSTKSLRRAQESALSA